MSDQRPNILFIIADHQIAHGHCRPGVFEFRLPVFEKFCAQGVNFERAYSVSPVSTPARASMMTGVYPSKHGLKWNSESKNVPGNRVEFAPGTELYSHHLARMGYRNAYVGKWHCGEQRLPVDYGIEGWSLTGYGAPYMSEAYAQYAKERGLGKATARIEQYINRPEWKGKTMELHHPVFWQFMFGSGVMLGPPEGHEEFFVAEMASQKVREMSKQKQPWSLVASFWGPHQPYYPTEPYAGMIDPKSIPEYPSFNDDYRGKPFRQFIHRDLMMGKVRQDSWPTWDIWQQVLARCYEQTIQTDAAVGRLLQTLEEEGVAENTLVIWLADHGDTLGSHGGLFDKGSTFPEEAARVPMALRWPAGLKGGVKTSKLVSNMDATATMLAAAGAPIPEGMQSRSLLELARSPQTTQWPDQLVCEHHGHYTDDIMLRMVVTDQYKYVAAIFDDDELYDLKNDPYEMKNLVYEPAYAELAKEMRGRLIAQLEGDWPAHRLVHALKYSNKHEMRKKG
ncbi:MAG: sulfatase-like hydrolase/transferase [Phycisphaeraceae bacterium]|nr:sulfatase-like hydrolase/transferase [Phycisphaeraceae bacterium]